MVHGHPVRDMDKHFIIDPITRAINNAEQKKTVLMQNDHNSEQFSFEIDRYVEGHDMLLCNKIELHYINVASSNRLENSGMYEITDFKLSETDSTKAVFTWLVSENATMYAGTLTFMILFACVENAVVTYRWHTDLNTSMTVSRTINNTEEITESYPDIIEQWREELFNSNYAYERAVQNGFKGSEQQWIASITGSATAIATANEAMEAANLAGTIAGNAALLVDSKTSKSTYTIALPVSGWGESAPYTQTVLVEGIIGNETAFADIDLSQATEETSSDILDSWGMVDRITVQLNSITAYCYSDLPTVDLTINLALFSQVEPMEETGSVAVIDDEIPTKFTVYSSSKTENDFGRLRIDKADAVIDESPRAEFHKLYSQRGNLSVALHGRTSEIGSAEKGPSNPYTIRGIDTAYVQTSGRNLFNPRDIWTTTNSTLDDEDWITAYIDNSSATGYAYANWFTNRMKGIKLYQTVTVVIEVNSATSYEGNVSIVMSGHAQSQFPRAEIVQPVAGKIYTNTLICDKPLGVGGLRPYVSYKDGSAGTIKYRITVLLGNVDTSDFVYERYSAVSIEPALLPDNCSIYGDGTINDVVEIDISSGCDKKIVLDGVNLKISVENGQSSNLNHFGFYISDKAYGSTNLFSDWLPVDYSGLRERISGRVNSNFVEVLLKNDRCDYSIDAANSYFAEHPLTIFYPSTSYHADNDLKINKTTRQWERIIADGTEAWGEYRSDESTETYKGFTLGNCKNSYAQSSIWQTCSHFAYGTATSPGYFPNVFLCHNTLSAIFIRAEIEGITSIDSWKQYLASQNAEGNPVTFLYRLAVPEIYATDSTTLPARASMPEMVTGSGNTSIIYAHDTKHYIDEKIAAAIAQSING